MLGLLWLLGPVTWLWALFTFGARALRLKRERELFGSAINASWLDLAANLIGGVIAALVVSGLAIGLGLVLPPHLLFVLTGCLVFALLLSPWRYSLAWLALAPMIDWGLAQFGVVAEASARQTAALVFFIGLLFSANALLLRFLNPPIDMPRIRSWRRGASIVTYTRRQWYLLPLVLPISGDTFSGLSWWPTLHFGGAHFALAGVPLILGAALTVKKSRPTEATDRWAKQYGVLGALLLLSGVALAWFPTVSPLIVGVLLMLMAFLLLGLQGSVLNRGNSYFVKASDGVRIIGVQPETPAAKMGLMAGDVILRVNDTPVTSERTFYLALQAHPTYARLKVRRFDGELVMTETAIYNGTPHEIGLKLFSEDM